MAFPTSRVGRPWDLKVLDFFQKKNIQQNSQKERKLVPDLKKTHEILFDRKLTIIVIYIYTYILYCWMLRLKLCLILLIWCSTCWIFICYIYIFYHHLSTFLKLDEVGASDIDFLLFYLCSKFSRRKMRTDLWLKLRWVCLPSFCEIFVCAGNNRWISLETTRGAYYFLVYVWYETSKSTSDTLLLSFSSLNVQFMGCGC